MMRGTYGVVAVLLTLGVATAAGDAAKPQLAEINAGTPGEVSVAATQSVAPSMSLVLLGDLAPTDSASDRTLRQVVRETNLLRPAAVFTVGGLIPGLTRSTQRYAEEAAALRGTLSGLQVPWFPCVGRTEVISGTRDPGDHRFERAFQQTFGPLYYSTNVGSVHVIVLDSEEGCGEGSSISEAQLAWLKADLNRTFLENSGGAFRSIAGRPPTVKWAIVLVHRPLWRIAEKQGAAVSNWDRVHRMLVDFNQRPIVSVEGAGISDGPRVVGVWAGAVRAYCKEPTRDGIRYSVLGPTSAHVEDAANAANAVRHFTLLTFDDAKEAGARGAVVHPALVAIGARSEREAAIMPDDVVTERERQVLDAIAALPASALGVKGAIELPAPPPPAAATRPATSQGASVAATQPVVPEIPALTMNIGNPLDVPLDVQVHLAESGEQRWTMDLPHQIRHLAPGAKEAWPARFTWTGRSEDAVPPVVEFVVHWADPHGEEEDEGGGGAGAGQVREVVIRRRVPVVGPLGGASVPVMAAVSLTGEGGWGDAVGGETYRWPGRGAWAGLASGGEPNRSPEWELAADAGHVYLRVRVEDGVKSYSPTMAIDPGWGGVASDAVSVAWTAGDKSALERRLWVVPFGPKGVELWEAPGHGGARPGEGGVLQRVPASAAAAVPVAVENRPDGYTLTLALPREWLLGAGTAATTRPASPIFRLAVEVSDNDDGAFTRRWSSAPMEGGSPLWESFRLASPSGAISGPPQAQKDNN